MPYAPQLLIPAYISTCGYSGEKGRVLVSGVSGLLMLTRRPRGFCRSGLSHQEVRYWCGAEANRITKLQHKGQFRFYQTYLLQFFTLKTAEYDSNQFQEARRQRLHYMAFYGPRDSIRDVYLELFAAQLAGPGNIVNGTKSL